MISIKYLLSEKE